MTVQTAQGVEGCNLLSGCRLAVAARLDTTPRFELVARSCVSTTLLVHPKPGIRPRRTYHSGVGMVLIP
jgi:hypothetical protein